jgi:hypothetical protein
MEAGRPSPFKNSSQLADVVQCRRNRTFVVHQDGLEPPHQVANLASSTGLHCIFQKSYYQTLVIGNFLSYSRTAPEAPIAKHLVRTRPYPGHYFCQGFHLAALWFNSERLLKNLELLILTWPSFKLTIGSVSTPFSQPFN